MNYCALLRDGVGLYVDNPVTQMGYPVGTVSRITPTADHVRVDFTVTTRHALPANVKAIIRSTSILADRSLELVSNSKTDTRQPPGECIPLSRTETPRSISEIIGSADDFVKAINPEGSKNIGDALQGLDKATRGNGAGFNRLLRKSSSLLDNPDQSISDLDSIITNLNTLTSTLNETKGPLKDAINGLTDTARDATGALNGLTPLGPALAPIINTGQMMELHLGDETQLTLDTVAMAMRKLSPHAQGIAGLLDPVPWWINTFNNHANNHQFNLLPYRPPLYRIRTPDGLALCGMMNASIPGSCADVNGRPYAADVSLLQLVFTQAAAR